MKSYLIVGHSIRLKTKTLIRQQAADWRGRGKAGITVAAREERDADDRSTEPYELITLEFEEA